jgi:transcriptional regulator with XRE-family HTH domain
MNTIGGCNFSAESGPPSAVPVVAAGGMPTAVANGNRTAPTPTAGPASNGRLQRLGEVRRREGLSCRQVAKCLGLTASEVRKRELPSSDMLLSELYRWQKVLGVPTGELLSEPSGELSPPVKLRAQLVKVMKTVRSIEAGARQVSIRRLATMLTEQLIDVMPELKDATPWPSGSHRHPEPLDPFDWRLFCRGQP